MSAELLLEGATVFDGVDLLASTTSIAISGGRILAISGESLDDLAGPSTVRRDLGGAFLMPGLVDVHNHHAIAGRTELYELQLPIGATLDDVLLAVADRAAGTAPGGWIVGGPLSTSLLPVLDSPEVLNRLDTASGGRPVMLIEDSRHNRWVSSEALRLAGILDGSHAHDDGVLDACGASGPTGVLLEGAGLLVEQALARAGGFTPEQYRASSARGVEILNSFGVTAFQDAATSIEMLEALQALDDAGALNAWVVSSMPMNDEIFGFTPLGHELLDLAEGTRTVHHRPDFVKVFLDGVPPTRTAAFLEPYLPDGVHDEGYSGKLMIPLDELIELMRDVASRGLGIKAHCTGDASARAILDATEALRHSGDTATRVHIAHGQFLAESDLARFSELDVTADMSPFVWFPGAIPDAIEKVLPQPLASRIQPARCLADLGARLAMGSDWPVSPTPNPWFGIHGLVTRSDPFRQATGQLWADQALTLTEALRACTSSGAEAIGLGDTVGRLAKGYSADFIVLDDNLFASDPMTLVDTQVLETWFAGRLVYERGR